MLVALLLLHCCFLLLPLCESVLVLCSVVRYFMYPSSFAIILMGKRELVALLSSSSWCLVIDVWLFLSVPWVCLQFVIVVLPDHTHLLFQIPCYCKCPVALPHGAVGLQFVFVVFPDHTHSLLEPHTSYL